MWRIRTILLARIRHCTQLLYVRYLFLCLTLVTLVQIVVTALMQAIPALCNVLVVCMVFWLIFSIMGVQFFSGKFYKCVDADGNRLEDTVVQNRSVCEANKDYSWSNSNIHFDNVFSGYLALFQVVSFLRYLLI